MNDPVVWLPAASVAVTLTVVVPTLKVEPEAGVLTIVTAPEQLSVGVGVIGWRSETPSMPLARKQGATQTTFRGERS